ncbi:MAG: hypothetical protein L0338_15985, partial [Acidobacteria bacterium]|nr:hypothetical protein [Acidobacteriota bacterium]
MALAAHLFGRFTAGIAAHRTLSRAATGTGLSLVLFSVWLHFGSSAAAIAFYLWTGVYGLLLTSQFWILANERVNPRQARRLFGLIGAGGILGGIVGGTVASLVGPAIAPHWLLLFVAGIYWVTAPLAERSGLRPEEGSADVSSTATAEASMSESLRRPYVRLLVLLFLLGGITSGVLDYQFKYALPRWSGDAGQLTAVLGLFYGAQNLLGLFAQLGLLGTLLSHFGARGVSALLPGGLFLGSAMTALVPSFSPVVASRLYDATLRISVARTAWEFLYFQLPDGVRRFSRRFIDGVVDRGAEAVAGVLILGLNAFLGGSTVQLALLCGALALAWLVTELFVNRAYAQEVSRSLDRMLVGGTQPAISLGEAGAVVELAALLDSADEKQVLYALDRLHSMDPEILRERAGSLLDHPSAVVRARARLLPALWDASQAYVGSAARLDTNPADAGTPLSEDPLQRLAMAAAAARSPSSEIARRQLTTLLDDSDLEVRRAAFRSVSLSGEREFVAVLIAKLVGVKSRKDAQQALASYGERVVGTLGDYLADPRAPLKARREIPWVLTQIGTQEAANSLFRATASVGEDRVLLQRTLWALNRIRRNNETVALPAEAVDEHLQEEIRLYLDLLVQRGTVGEPADDPARRLLVRVLGERIVQCRERIFRRLALLYPPRDILRAHRGLVSLSARVRAQSIEYLETILSAEHKTLFAFLLDDAPEGERARRAALSLKVAHPTLGETLRVLAEGGDAWLRACALFMIGSHGLADLSDRINENLASSDPTIQETAMWARGQLQRTEAKRHAG